VFGLRLGSIPVRIHGSFFLMTLLLGAAAGRGPVQEHVAIGIWAVVVFVSVLVHELGHAVVGKAFGLAPQIDLHGMGGTTSWSSGRDLGNLRSIAISLAGPFAGFAVGATVLIAVRAGLFVPSSPVAELVVRQVLWVNIGWGIINLMPLLPLDGGNVMRSFLNAVTKGRGEKPARVVSIVFCALIVGFALMNREVWIGLLGALFLMRNIQALRAADQTLANAPLARAIEASYAALDKQDSAEAIRLLRPVLVPQASPELRQVGLRIYAYALLLEGNWGELMPLLEREREAIGVEELARFARTAHELGRPDEAAQIERLAEPPAA
jgi:Zn-dependent protease